MGWWGFEKREQFLRLGSGHAAEMGPEAPIVTFKTFEICHDVGYRGLRGSYNIAKGDPVAMREVGAPWPLQYRLRSLSSLDLRLSICKWVALRPRIVA